MNLTTVLILATMLVEHSGLGPDTGYFQRQRWSTTTCPG